MEKGNCTLTSAFQSFRPCCQKCWAPAETLWSPRPHCHPCRTHLQKCEKQSTMVFLIKNLQLSWQGGYFGVLEAREAPAGSTFQSCRSPACETWSFREWWYQRNWWIGFLWTLSTTFHMFQYQSLPFAQALDLIRGEGSGLGRLAVAHLLQGSRLKTAQRRTEFHRFVQWCSPRGQWMRLISIKTVAFGIWG